MDLEQPEKDDAWLQERYARCLDLSTKTAFVVLLCAFPLYVGGILPPYVPLEQLPELWQLPLARYLERTGAPTGWQWLRVVSLGDYANYLGVSLLALIVLLCDLAVLPSLLKRGERVLAALAMAQIVVLAAAASGSFAGG
jgi:hypothetical protein